jgi:hypothetical protein
MRRGLESGETDISFIESEECGPSSKSDMFNPEAKSPPGDLTDMGTSHGAQATDCAAECGGLTVANASVNARRNHPIAFDICGQS